MEIVIGGEEDDDEPELTMGRYRWQSYVLEEDDLDLEDATRQISMTGLLRSSLLKRLESSVYALAQTCGRMAESCEGFLDLLSNGFIANSDILGQWMADDIEEDDMERILETNPDNVTRTDGYNVEQLRADVENDLILFRELQEMQDNSCEEDPKLLPP